MTARRSWRSRFSQILYRCGTLWKLHKGIGVQFPYACLVDTAWRYHDCFPILDIGIRSFLFSVTWLLKCIAPDSGSERGRVAGSRTENV
ncbi:hypothetical protein Bxe_A3832 [Paraburkholderia xenovorans LB400]|uniref:Uncharacterized protein n=1 Tax=Paraburkholderia xenovorans (strain LB400) TaxID=266265 RepID=Q144S3_PARXL|nr:hypothetical protein Bxe_A3832 [Paraburkholderia xenovorans LB400]